MNKLRKKPAPDITTSQQIDITSDVYGSVNMFQIGARWRTRAKYLLNFFLASIVLFIVSSVNCSAQNKLDIKPLPGDIEWYHWSSDGVRLYIYEMGTGKDTVLVIHGGFGAEHGYLLTALKPLASKYHFIFFDQRGSLRSPCPDSLLTVENMIGDIESIRKELHIKNLNIIAHSMGSWLTSYYMQKYPDHIKGVVLCALYQIRNYEHPEYKKWAAANDSLFAVFQHRPAYYLELHKLGFKSDTVKHLSGKLNSQKWRLQFAAANIYHLDRWKQIEGGMAFYNNHTGQLLYDKRPKDWDFVEVYKRSNFPITIVNGDYDFSDLGGKEYSRWLSGILNVKFVLIPFAGHNAWLDQPAIFKTDVDRGLQRTLHGGVGSF